MKQIADRMLFTRFLLRPNRKVLRVPAGAPVRMMAFDGRQMAEGRVGEWLDVEQSGVALNLTIDLPDGSLLLWPMGRPLWSGASINLTDGAVP